MAKLMALLALLAAAACTAQATPEVRRFQLTGTIVGRESTPPRLVVAHDAIGSFMPAMTMPFDVRGTVPPAGKGDRLEATLVVGDGGSWLEDVRVTARGDAPRPPQGASRASPGAVVPPLPLVDQSGARTTLRAPDGRVQVVTFIYTRCPVPDFCPLMVKHLERVRRRVNEAGAGDRLALVAITLDPAFDTPAVLRAYGESVLKGSDRFEQWTLATGTAREVEAAAQFFGVGYRSDSGFVVHTLTTVVVGRDGRVIRLFDSNSWRPDDLFDIVRQAIDRTAP